MKEFNNKIVVITGGASGIGKGIVNAFAKNGAKIFFADINEQLGLITQEEIILATGNHQIEYVKADLSNKVDVRNLVNYILGKEGFIDVLINNAGVNLRSGSILEHDSADFERTFRINVLSDILMIQGFLPSMIKRKKGAIINISSTMSYGAEGVSAYATSKGSINTLTKSLALDHARDGIRINAVAPGLISTPATEKWISEQEDPAKAKGVPMGTVGTPEDIANAVLFLASDKAAYITGHILVVDGGLSVGE